MKITKELHKELLKAFDEIQQPRTNYELEKLVVGAKFTEPQAYAQCVLELSIKYDDMRLAQINMERKQIEISELKKKGKSRLIELDIAEKEIQLEQTERAYLGAEREFEYLYFMWTKFPKKYTREDLNNNSPLEFKKRLETQALFDIQSSGRVQVGNLEGLRQMDIDPASIGFTPIQRDEVETRFLEEGKLRALIVIPSEHRMSSTQIDCLLKDVVFPSNVEMRIENISESPVADNYNTGIEKAIKEGCTHLVTIEDDQVLNPDSLLKLFDFALKNPNSCVGAWYPKRQKVRQGVHIKLSGGHRRFLEDDGNIHELKTMAMGLSIYPVSILSKLDFPYCKTTDSLSQDSYLSQKIRDKGYTLLCDTNIKIGHKDRDGEIYI